MKKLSKLLILPILMLSLCFGLVGCGNNNNDDSLSAMQIKKAINAVVSDMVGTDVANVRTMANPTLMSLARTQINETDEVCDYFYSQVSNAISQYKNDESNLWMSNQKQKILQHGELDSIFFLPISVANQYFTVSQVLLDTNQESSQSIYNEIKSYVDGAENEQERILRFKEMIDLYNTDPSMVDPTFEYVMGVDETMFIDSFTNASRDLFATAIKGSMSELVYMPDFGYTIIMYTRNISDFICTDEEMTDLDSFLYATTTSYGTKTFYDIIVEKHNYVRLEYVGPHNYFNSGIAQYSQIVFDIDNDFSREIDSIILGKAGWGETGQYITPQIQGSIYTYSLNEAGEYDLSVAIQTSYGLKGMSMRIHVYESALDITQFIETETLTFYAIPYVLLNNFSNIQQNKIYKDSWTGSIDGLKDEVTTTVKGLWYEVKKQNGKNIIYVNIITNILNADRNDEVTLQIAIDYNFTNDNYTSTYYLKSENIRTGEPVTIERKMQTVEKKNGEIIKYEMILFNIEKDNQVTALQLTISDIYYFNAIVADNNGIKTNFTDNEKLTKAKALMSKDSDLKTISNQQLNNATQLNIIEQVNEFIISALS